MYSYDYSNVNLSNNTYDSHRQNNIKSSSSTRRLQTFLPNSSRILRDMLPNNTTITEVHCKVTPLGMRTVFDHGTSLTGMAMTQYVGIGSHGIGLNKAFYGRNLQYKSSTNDPMVPTDVSQWDVQAFQKKNSTQTWQAHQCYSPEAWTHTGHRYEIKQQNQLPSLQIRVIFLIKPGSTTWTNTAHNSR